LREGWQRESNVEQSKTAILVNSLTEIIEKFYFLQKPTKQGLAKIKI
jgi:hypothetical protein